MESGAHRAGSLSSAPGEGRVPGLRCGRAPRSGICERASPPGIECEPAVLWRKSEMVRPPRGCAGMWRLVARGHLGPARSFRPCPGMNFLPWPPHFPVCTLLGPDCSGQMRRWPDPCYAHWSLVRLCVIPDPRDSNLGVGRDREVSQDTHLPVPHAGGEPEACLGAGEGF